MKSHTKYMLRTLIEVFIASVATPLMVWFFGSYYIYYIDLSDLKYIMLWIGVAILNFYFVWRRREKDKAFSPFKRVLLSILLQGVVMNIIVGNVIDSMSSNDNGSNAGVVLILGLIFVVPMEINFYTLILWIAGKVIKYFSISED